MNDKGKTYLCLHSKHGVPSAQRKGALVFTLENPLWYVQRVAWDSLEMEVDGGVTVSPSACRLYFSEGNVFYRATVPCGRYTAENLWRSIESALACASSSVSTPPLNRYLVRYLTDTQALCIASDNRVPFTLHLCHNIISVKGVRRVSESQHEYDVDVVFEGHGMMPGSWATLSRGGGPGRVAQHRVQVVVVVGSDPAGVSSGTLRVRCQDDVSQTGEATLCPDSRQDNLGPMLGLGSKDVSCEEGISIEIVPDETVVLGPGKHAWHVTADTPHGCEVGDEVKLGAASTALVYRVVSDHHLVVVVVRTTASINANVLTRPVVVGSGRLEILRPRQVLYTRCWVGSKELGGMMLVKRGGLDVFGRVRLASDGGHAVRGEWVLNGGGLSRVSVVELMFVNDDGEVVEGLNYSVVLRVDNHHLL